MAEAFLHFGGGGSSESLNFTVIGGTSQPATASENTIWVNTDTTITGYTISATAPEEPTEGMVWIIPGAAGDAFVVVTKKNPIRVYPMSAKQYIGGDWVEVTAKNWQDGEWVDWWSGELYKDGDEYTSYTGGWELGEVNGGTTGIMTKAKKWTTLKGGSGNRSHVETKNMVDLSKHNNLILTVEITSISATGKIRLGYTEAKKTSLTDVTTMEEKQPGANTIGEYSFSLDISSAPDKAYVVVGAGVSNTVFNIKKVQMTK